MRLLRNLTILILVTAAVALTPKRADAGLLTLFDGTDKWTLNVQEGCTTCNVVLSVQYFPTSSRLGNDLGSIQWDLTDPNVNPSVIGFFSTSGTGNNFADWSFSFNSVNNAGSNAGCGGGDSNAVCGVNVNASSGGGLTVVPGTFTWTFHSQFASTLSGLTTGNIRAAYDVGGIFSPGGGKFGPSCTGDCGATVPEPALMMLFGLGSLAAAYRVRRRATR